MQTFLGHLYPPAYPLGPQSQGALRQLTKRRPIIPLFRKSGLITQNSMGTPPLAFSLLCKINDEDGYSPCLLLYTSVTHYRFTCDKVITKQTGSIPIMFFCMAMGTKPSRSGDSSPAAGWKSASDPFYRLRPPSPASMILYGCMKV